MSLLVSGGFHQADERFTDESRGKQCAFITLSALLTAQNTPDTEWNSATIDNVLLQGYEMYLNALDNCQIPREQFLLVDHLPKIVSNDFLTDKPSNLPFEVCTYKCFEMQNIDLPIPAEPIEEQNIDNDLPIAAEPIEAQPIIEAQIDNDPNKSQIWIINYGKDRQGLVINQCETEPPYHTINSALLNTFINANYAILILEGYMMALIKHSDSFYLFDSHARDTNGFPDPNGTAVVMKFNNTVHLEQHICSLSMELNANLFEIVPVQIPMSQCNKTRLEKDREYHKQKRLEKSHSI
jgi:hypothetical protein